MKSKQKASREELSVIDDIIEQAEKSNIKVKRPSTRPKKAAKLKIKKEKHA